MNFAITYTKYYPDKKYPNLIRNMPKPITLGLLKSRTGPQPFNEVTKLNLWGVDCEDVAILSMLPKLQTLQLSRNHLVSLKQISKLKQLRELNLSYNAIKDLRELEYLKELNNLHVLNFIGNPIVENPDYRKTVVKYCFSLKILDDLVISDQERQETIELDLEIQEQSLMQDLSNNDERQIEQIINDSILNNGSNSKTPILLSDHSTNYSKHIQNKNKMTLFGKLNGNIIRSYTQYSENISGNSIEKPRSVLFSSKGSTKKSLKNKKKQNKKNPQELIEVESIQTPVKEFEIDNLKYQNNLFLVDNSDITNQKIQEEKIEKNCEEPTKSVSTNQDVDFEEIKFYQKDEQLNQYIVGVISEFINFINKDALQCLYQSLCDLQQ